MGKTSGWLDEVKQVRDQVIKDKETQKEEARKAREKSFQEREAGAEALDKEATALAEMLEKTLTAANQELFSDFDSDAPVVFNSTKDANAIYHLLEWDRVTNHDLPYGSKTIAYQVILLGVPLCDLFGDKRLQFEYASYYFLIFADFLNPSPLKLRSCWRGHRRGSRKIYISEPRTIKTEEAKIQATFSTDLQRLYKGELDFCYVQYKYVGQINVLSRSYGTKSRGLAIGGQKV